MSKDLYKILEVSKGADASEIRKQYLKLSRQYHPDKVSNDQKEVAEEKFKVISQAYEVLSDPEQKSYYDMTGQLPGEGGGSGVGRGGGGMPFPFDINQMFGMFGGGGGMRQQPRGRRQGKAPPRKTQIALTLKDFYYGRTLSIHLDRVRFCAACKGEGCLNTKSCGGCGGQGVRKQIMQMGPMMVENIGPCTTCSGSGKTKGDSCTTCSGTKFIKQEKQLELLIKKGMKPGDIVTFSGESSHVEEFQEPGDVLVELQAADEDSLWIREGSTLKITATITLCESLCGTKLIFKDHPGYPDGIVLDIPVGVQSKDTIVFGGLGMPVDDQFGDLLITITVRPSKSEIDILKNNSPYFQGLFTLPEVVVGDMKIFNSKRIY